MSRSAGNKTGKQKLHPNRGVIAVTAWGAVELPPDQVTVERIGQKAVGLLTIPPNWTPPFFIVLNEALNAGISPDDVHKWIEDAAFRSGVDASRVMVRSNGVEEGLSQRGALASISCAWSDVSRTINILREQALQITDSPTHWIVQNEVIAHAQGQLSNERRLRYEKRDWIIEIEASTARASNQISIGIRSWREGRNVTNEPLSCDSVMKISLTLRRVAMWAVQDSRRFLFEWVWDGSIVHIVQMDVATTTAGEVPHDLLPVRIAPASIVRLQTFKKADAEDKRTLRKLANAALYEQLGYSMPPFYVLDNQPELRVVINEGEISTALMADLETLTRRSLVLRTDGSTLPPEKREMLPRSEELRTGRAAADWLLGSFAPAIRELGLVDTSIALVGHHFIPSVASAWAGAEPGRRWVRIEALWGIPESLYWHSHDTFEVDTEKADLSLTSPNGCEYPIRSRLRFKGTFIAPDLSGAWVHHQTMPPFDWSAAISSTQWLCEIAHTTRRICEHIRKPVEVMWFVDNHRDATDHKVLPWYHSSPENLDVPVRAPRKKIKTSHEHYIRDQQDWSKLQASVQTGTKIERVIVEPYDPALVRNQTFAKELGTLAQQHGIVVVLAGGILSHAYHALRRAGASVECVDLFGATEEQAEFNKVVRDRVPAQIANRGEYFEIVRLVGDALLLALRRKLVEEALEALDANTGTDLIAELADVQEVVKAIAKAIQVSSQQLEEERAHKLGKRGGFDEGYMLLTTSSPYSIPRQSSPSPLIEVPENPEIRTISDPAGVPHKAVYKRPDHRSLAHGTEELLVIETELNRLGTLVEFINFELPLNVDARQYTSFIELSRTGGELRAAVRLQARERTGETEGQLAFDFERP
jgi:predicted house-cleaning noncanonical NTP pyrophosphatase (MazG superfamily)